MYPIKISRRSFYLVAISSLLIMACGCSEISASTPTATVNTQTQAEVTSAPEPSSTSLSIPSPTFTQAPVIQNTQSPTNTPTVKATEALAGETGGTEERKTYPQLAPAELYTNPDEYLGKRFMFTGVLVAYGTRKLDDKDMFILQVGVPEYSQPIIVLNFTQNSRLATHDGIIIGGTGGGTYTFTDSNGIKQLVPVINGEWYECNIPVDQQEFPPEFWVPIP